MSGPRGTAASDLTLLAAMSQQPEMVLHIAARVGRPVMDVERDLYRLACVRPGQPQPEGVGRVKNYRAGVGVPVLWSRMPVGNVLLVTGSRRWTARAPIREAFEAVLVRWGLPASAVTVRHGGQGKRDRDTGEVLSGFDLLAGEVAEELGMQVDQQKADWHGPCRAECGHGPRKVAYGRDYCQMAGFYRNRDRLIAPGARECLGFPLGKSPGTRDCMRSAEAAGIPTRPGVTDDAQLRYTG